MVLEALPAIENSPRAAVYQPVAVKELDRAGILDKCRRIGFSGSEIVWRKAVAPSSTTPAAGSGDGGEEEGIVAGSGSERGSYADRRSEVILSMSRKPSPDEPYENLVLGQHELAAVILEEFLKSGAGRVLFNQKAVGIEQDDEGVSVRTEVQGREGQEPEQQKQLFRAQYVVGADGGKSFVRRHLGLSFDGFTWDRPIVATNVVYPFDEYGMATGNFVV